MSVAGFRCTINSSKCVVLRNLEILYCQSINIPTYLSEGFSNRLLRHMKLIEGED